MIFSVVFLVCALDSVICLRCAFVQSEIRTSGFGWCKYQLPENIMAKVMGRANLGSWTRYFLKFVSLWNYYFCLKFVILIIISKWFVETFHLLSCYLFKQYFCTAGGHCANHGQQVLVVFGWYFCLCSGFCSSFLFSVCAVWDLSE